MNNFYTSNKTSSLALQMYNSKEPTLVDNDILGDLIQHLQIYPGEIKVEEHSHKQVLITKLPYKAN